MIFVSHCGNCYPFFLLISFPCKLEAAFDVCVYNSAFFHQGSLVNTLKEVRPTAFMGVPRVWEKMQEKMKAVGAKSSTVRRKVAAWAKDVGLQTNLTKMNQYVHPVQTCLNCSSLFSHFECVFFT